MAYDHRQHWQEQQCERWLEDQGCWIGTPPSGNPHPRGRSPIAIELESQTTYHELAFGEPGDPAVVGDWQEAVVAIARVKGISIPWEIEATYSRQITFMTEKECVQTAKQIGGTVSVHREGTTWFGFWNRKDELYPLCINTSGRGDREKVYSLRLALAAFAKAQRKFEDGRVRLTDEPLPQSW